MANKRLIDADAFKMHLEEIRQDYLEEDTYSSNFAAEVIETVQDEYLANAPTVDAVEVLRCKNCKHWDDPNKGGRGMCWKKVTRTEEDHYCGYGEKREG